MKDKLHIIWDMDGTLVNSGPEIYATIEKCLTKVGVSINDAIKPLRIGPPIKDILRNSFTIEIMTDYQLDVAVNCFREIYDISDYRETIPYLGIDEILHSKKFVNHVITNKPYIATKRIIEKKGWSDCISEILTPQYKEKELNRLMKKHELFAIFKSSHNSDKIVGIGDMAVDSYCANTIGITSIGVLWGAGTKEELLVANCNYIVSSVEELYELLRKL